MKRHRALAGHSASHERVFVGLRFGPEHRCVRGRQIGILRLLAEYPERERGRAYVFRRLAQPGPRAVARLRVWVVASTGAVLSRPEKSHFRCISRSGGADGARVRLIDRCHVVWQLI